MSKNPEKIKSKHQLDLLDEKQAYVVIALTDKLSLAGKLVALNALAHYNSKHGYSWPSIPVVAEESGYSPASTKSISPGFGEIKKVGAFSVIRNPASKGSKKSSTYRCCPIMPWFRSEYARLRQIGKIEEDSDPFADIRSDNDNDTRQGSQPGQDERQGSQPGHTGSTTRSDRVINPVTQGYKPEEENRTKRTDRNEQTTDSSASRRKGPVGLIVVGVGDEAPPVSDWPEPAEDHRSGETEQAKPNDEARLTPPGGEWPVDIVDKFQSHYPKGGDRTKISEALDAIRLEGLTDYRDILRGADNYKRDEKKKIEAGFVIYPENFLTKRLHTGYQKDNRPKPKKGGAI